MARPKLLEVLPGFLLYVISVYQPCEDSLVVKALQGVKGEEGLPRTKDSGKYVKSIGWLIEQNLIRRMGSGEYVVTKAGLLFLGKQRLAFPRDKFRLYFLHKLISGRSR